MQTTNTLPKIKIAISKKSYRTKAESEANIGALTSDCQVVTANINEFSEKLKRGYAWTAPADNNGKFYRKKEYFQGADIFGIDIDNKPGHKYLSITDALNDPFIKNNAWLIYPTFSSTPEHNRFRIIFHLPETVTDLNKYESIISAFISIYDSDPVCKDAVRLFFGTDKQDIYLLNNRLNWDILQAFTKSATKKPTEIISKPRKEAKPRVTTPPKPKVKPATNENQTAPFYVEYESATKERLIEYCVSIVNKARNGEKYHCLLKAAVLMGGYIASGKVGNKEGIDALKQAISKKRGVKSLPDAFQTIKAGIRHGKSQPVDYQYKFGIFPICLLGYKSGYETIEAIKEYCQGKPDPETLKFIDDFENQFGNDGKASIPLCIIDQALNRQLGKKSDVNFRVYAAVRSFFNRKSVRYGVHFHTIRKEFIKRRAAGYKSKAIFPEGTPALTHRQIQTACDNLHDLNLLWSLVIKKRNKYFGLPEKFENYNEFQDRIIAHEKARPQRKKNSVNRMLYDQLLKAISTESAELKKSDYNRQARPKVVYRN